MVEFVHPGTMFLKSEIPEMLKRTKTNPKSASAYANLEKATPHTYIPKPHAHMTINWGRWDPATARVHTELMADGQQSYQQALMYVLTNDQTYAKNALAIVNAWSTVNVSADGTNMPLEFAWCQPSFARAMELLKYTYPHYVTEGVPVEKAYMKWLDEVVMPLLTKRISWTNNWLITMCAARMQIAILRNDHTEFQNTIAAFKSYVPDLIETCGLPVEVKRDLTHTQFTLGSLAMVCQMAWNQGVDLYSYSNNIVFKAFEMTAAILLGEKPPATKGIDLKTLSMKPAFWDTVIYHYVEVKKLCMPNATKLLSEKRPEFILWCWGLSTLTHYH